MSKILRSQCPECEKYGSNHVISTDHIRYKLETNLDRSFRIQIRECVRCQSKYKVCIIPYRYVEQLEKELLQSRETIKKLNQRIDNLTPNSKEKVLSRAKKHIQQEISFPGYRLVGDLLK